MKFVFALLAVALLGFSSASPVAKGTGRTYGNFGPRIRKTFEIKPKALFESSIVQNEPIAIAKLHISLASKVDESAIRVSASHKNDKNGVTHVYLQQVVNGLDVVNAVANVNVNAEGKIVSVGNGFFKNAVPAADFANSVKLSAADAVSALAQLLKLNAPKHLVTVQEKVGDPFSFKVSGAEFAIGDIPTELKYIQGESGSKLVPVWDIRVEMKDNMYNAFVDTTTGEVVSLIDWITDATYNVFPFGINDPDRGDRESIVDPAHPVASPRGWHSRGEGEDSTFTIGNNAFVQDNPDGGIDYINNYRPDGGETQVFNFPIDLTKEPIAYLDAAATNLFYVTNMIHDLLYVYGFDEKAGNFQQNNFGRGGEENDAVVAFVQDPTGFNNANFMTPPDGQQGRMRMNLFNIQTPQRDSSLEGGTAVHEYAHGLSTRLTGGPSNVGCVPWGEPGGLGEGWGDWIAAITQTTVNSTRDDIFTVAAYTLGWPMGGRKFPYSTNMEINPSTYGFLERYEYYPTHAIGEVWAVILYEVFWNVVEQNGFEPNWFNTNSRGGNVKMLQLVIDGMKLQPCYPTLVDARDAIIQADELNNNSENFCAIWKGFAKRGLGINAVTGGDDWEWSGAENFEIPEECV